MPILLHPDLIAGCTLCDDATLCEDHALREVLAQEALAAQSEEERAFNQSRGEPLTGICGECFEATRAERPLCSYKCHRQYTLDHRATSR